MKLLVSDYDKTLRLNYDFKSDFFVKFSIDAIRRFIDNGNIFMLNTGRELKSIKEEIDIHKIPYNYLACNDGCLLLNQKDDVLKVHGINDTQYNYEYLISLLKEQGIEPNIVNGLIVISQEEFNKHPFIADMCYLNYNVIDNNVILEPKSLDQAIRCFLEFNEELNLLEWKYGSTILEYGFIPKDEDMIVNKKNQPRIYNNIDVIAKLYNTYYFVIRKKLMMLKRKDVNKTSMIEEVQRINDVDYDDIYTIGDNINDYRMVKEYHGYTLPWAKKSLIDVCEGVVPSVRTLIKRIER